MTVGLVRAGFFSWERRLTKPDSPVNTPVLADVADAPPAAFGRPDRATARRCSGAGKRSVAPIPRNAQTAAGRGPPRALAPPLRRLVSPAAVTSVPLTERLPAKDAVVLDTEYLGKGKDPWGNTRYGFHAETKINRKDFGMTWNEVVEAGGVLVGDEVEIVLDVEAVPAKP